MIFEQKSFERGYTFIHYAQMYDVRSLPLLSDPTCETLLF